MTVDPDARLAQNVLRRCLGLRPGETVGIVTWNHGLPWARALAVAARRHGIGSTLLVEDEEAFFQSLERAPRRPRAPGAGPAPSAFDAWVILEGPEAFPRLFGLPMADRALVAARRDSAWWARARRSGARVTRLALGDATPTAAERFGVDLAGWRRELVAASTIPPARLLRRATALLRQAGTARSVRIVHPNGTDLTADLRPGSARVETGRPTDLPTDHFARVPSGRLVVGLRGGSARGRWEANRPSIDRFSESPVLEGARFSLEGGRVREFSVERGGESFASAYARGGVGRDRVTELAFGLNPAVDRAPEVAELGASAVTLWVGTPTGGEPGGPRRFSFGATLREPSVAWEGRER